jgi:hypothetical protein
LLQTPLRPQKLTAKKKIVTFSATQEIFELPEVNCLEKTAAWHRSSDYKTILLGVQGDVVAFLQSQSHSDCYVNMDAHCWRGLEKYFDNNASRLLRQQTINAVLGHQCFQRAANKPDTESLAIMSRCFSKLAREKALELASFDSRT